MTEFVIDFDEIFNDFIAANQKKWSHDRSTTLGASEVYDCLRKGWFEKRGAEFDPPYLPDVDHEEDWGALTRGNLIENHHVVPAVRSHMPPGVEMIYTGDDQETLVLGRNSATPDGLITGLPMNCAVRIKGGSQDIFIPNIKADCIVFEIKSIDPRATLVEERTKHHNQTQVQLGLFRALTPFKPHYAIVLYIDASFLSKVTPFVVEYDEAVYTEARSRAHNVWDIHDPNEIMPEGRFSGACEHCRWRNACGTASVEAIPQYETDLTPESEAKLMPLILDYTAKKEAKAKAEEAEVVAKELIKKFLSGTNSRKVRTEGWSISWFGNKGRQTYDTAAMEADGIDIGQYRKDGTPFDVLRIAPRQKKKAKE